MFSILSMPEFAGRLFVCICVVKKDCVYISSIVNMFIYLYTVLNRMSVFVFYYVSPLPPEPPRTALGPGTG